MKISVILRESRAARYVNDCIQIRRKLTHEISQEKEHKQIKLIHNNGDDWIWGVSGKYGFHCFNGYQENGKCPFFEYRTYRK